MNRAQESGGDPINKPPRRMSRNRARTKEQRERVLEAIAEIVARDDLKTITMDNIASRMGGSTGTIYYYFKSKGEMLYYAHMYGLDLVEAMVFPVLDDKTIPPTERLARAVHAHMKADCEHWQLWRLSWSDATMAQVPPELKSVLVRRRRRFVNRYAELVREALTPEMENSIEPLTVARMIVGLIGSVTDWYRPGGKLSANDMAQTVVRLIVDQLFEPRTTSLATAVHLEEMAPRQSPA